MQKVVDFLKNAETYYLATVDGDQPRVRPFGTVNVFEGKFYIQTGKVKDVSKQIHYFRWIDCPIQLFICKSGCFGYISSGPPYILKSQKNIPRLSRSVRHPRLVLSHAESL